MANVIILDIDGVLRDLVIQIQNTFLYHNPKYSKDDLKEIISYDMGPFFPPGTDINKFVWGTHPNITKSIFEDAPTIGDPSSIINELRKLGHTIILATDQKQGTEHYTLNWLLKHHIIYDAIFFGKQKYYIKDEDIKIFVDDYPKNLIAYRNTSPHNTHVLCYDQPYNRQLDNSGIKRIYSLIELINLK